MAEADAREVRERIDAGPDAVALAAWEAARPRLAASVPPSTFKLWLESLEVAGAAGATLFLAAPDGIRSWVERRYASLIREALDGTDFRDVEFVTGGGAECP